MLEMRPLCEACGRILPADRDGAFICSMECTFCSDCVVGPLDGACPNCKGELRPRPPRGGDLLARYPAAAARPA
ncbi:DUF1272 domain-containing protein [Sphingomonas oligoaromativorans]|uniref:DUF1272 domain-containing protein n=1 Tax=Sphingomonas oligoaromativorans TaxID=575322 RepID=UPI001420F915|nr:DUF1272 domain-containing protein [Sphingomonas oligoaromativorans]NIJ31943.1 hypothetical protein [Sphingomonas oligoaromativorans]